MTYFKSDKLLVKAIRTDCRDRNKHEDVVIIIETFMPGWCNDVCIAITNGGVTGHESAFVKDLFSMNKLYNLNGWHACAGTENQWDTLFIPAESMQQIHEWLKELGHVT